MALDEVEGFSDDGPADRQESMGIETAETSRFLTGTASGGVAILEEVASMRMGGFWVAGTAGRLASAAGGVNDKVGAASGGTGVVSAVGATGIPATGTMDES